jgi:hypothetical protein
MAYAEINDAGEFVLDEAGEKVLYEPPSNSWETVQTLIPEEFKDEKMWENVPDTETLLKNYAHAQKRMGNAVNIPGEDASAEDKAEFFAKLGRPESAADYEVEFPTLPEGTVWDEQAQNGFMQAAHEAGLNEAQVKGILGWYGEYQKDVGLAGDEAIGKVTEELTKEWGANFEGNVALAQKAVAKLGGVEFQAVLDETGLGNHPDLIRAMARAGRLMQEHNIISGEVQGVSNRDDAKTKLSAIYADSGHPYWDGAGNARPVNQAAQDEVRRLNEIAYGSIV